MSSKNRGDVWLGVAGVVFKDDHYLVVKKGYSGLKGKWSFPAGFVDPGETIDQAVLREVHEETGIIARVDTILGIRSGVINQQISDNMIVFGLTYQSGELHMDSRELLEVAWLTKQELLQDPLTANIVRYFITLKQPARIQEYGHTPEPQFGYTSYKLFY